MGCTQLLYFPLSVSNLQFSHFIAKEQKYKFQLEFRAQGQISSSRSQNKSLVAFVFSLYRLHLLGLGYMSLKMAGAAGVQLMCGSFQSQLVHLAPIRVRHCAARQSLWAFPLQASCTFNHTAESFLQRI
jgi:hypothetical protein